MYTATVIAAIIIHTVSCCANNQLHNWSANAAAYEYGFLVNSASMTINPWTDSLATFEDPNCIPTFTGIHAINGDTSS